MTLEKYVIAAAEEAGEPIEVILGQNRSAYIVKARHHQMVLAMKAGHTSASIARAFHRDRTTVQHVLKKQRRNEPRNV